MANIPITVNPGQTKTITFECANTYTPEDIVFTIDGGTTGTELSGIAYCDTAAGTQAKVATFPGFALENGQRIILQLVNTNTQSGATLNVNSTGAKTVKINGSNTTVSNFTAGFWLCDYSSSSSSWNAQKIEWTDNNNNQKIKTTANGSSAASSWGDDASIEIAKGTNIILTTTNTSGSEKLIIAHDTPSGASSKSSQGGVSGNTLTIPTISTDSQGHVTGLTTSTYTVTPNTDEKVTPVLRGTGSYQILFAPTSDGTTNGQPTIVENTYIDIDSNHLFVGGQQVAIIADLGQITSAYDGNLKIKANYTGSNGTNTDNNGGKIFSANSASEGTISITGLNGIKTYRNTSSQEISIQHTNSVNAQSTSALYKITYDAQGHITSSTAAQASDITTLIGSIPSAPGAGVLTVSGDNNLTITNNTFSANASSNSTLTISHTTQQNISTGLLYNQVEVDEYGHVTFGNYDRPPHIYYGNDPSEAGDSQNGDLFVVINQQ